MTTLDLSHSRPGLTARLKGQTHEAHGGLDAAIMAKRPFADRERYGRFLAVQHAFHRDVDALYVDPALGRLLPGLATLRRLPLVVQDRADLGPSGPEPAGEPVFREGQPHDLAASLGWLYVAEGSNLGAAFLLKEAAKLGLSDTFGARHLAPAAEGRGLHWRTFAAALDDVHLSEDEGRRATEGAAAAFERVRVLVKTTFA
ncbi:biliverdin-producing heme oxygenase [Methylopila sp. 73B]|uniref:biliverdin-producing heme oxygenase n=1 Tax=Methylopila sp. 73B TaxID=1120792 RepID=UPI00038070A3|nr:biliverdin-producing heme oxygenase [Methylopila sp. 73B]